MTPPTLKFNLNKDLDIAMGTEFLDVKGGGVDFGKTVVRIHPELKEAKEVKDIDGRKTKVKAFTDRFYQRNKNRLEKKREEFENTWRSVESRFFETVSDLFEGYPWPNGDYICFISIFPCNPRFLENKTFQCYWKHEKGIKYVSTHELLHFMFYDYVETKHPTEVKKLEEEKLWEISEIFNSVILALPELVEITGITNPYIYPDLEKDYQEAKLIWKGSKNVPEFIAKILNFESV